MEKHETILELPVLALRGLVLFPNMTLHFDVGRKASINAVRHALKEHTDILLTAQKDIDVENPDIDDLYSVGTVAEVKQVISISSSDKTLRVIVRGKYRASLIDISSKFPYYKGTVSTVHEDEMNDADKLYEKALIRHAKSKFDDYCNITQKTGRELLFSVLDCENAGEISDLIASNIFFNVSQKQTILEETHPIRRIERLITMLEEENTIAALERKIHSAVQQRMDDNQNEYYLREQIKAIYEELGEEENPDEERDRYLAKINAAAMPEESKEKLRTEARRLGKMSSSSPDANVSRTYLDKCLELPWGIYTKDSINLKKVRKVLDRDHYGLTQVKERIVEMLAVRAVSPDVKGQIICLAGPPGVGKTSIARSVAEAMGRNYVRVALGGVHDEAEIRGHRRTYIGAIPGRIINAIIDAKSANPLVLLDEIDKLSGDFRGDPASALLEVLDSAQNSTYVDHYIDLPFDLSKTLFITTANDKSSIPAPLLDRMEIIDVNSYTHEEKFNIAKKHLLPKQMKEHGITKQDLKVTDKALRTVIDGYTREAGVRALERQLAKICRKCDVAIAEGSEDCITVTEKNIEDYLGAVKFREEDMYLHDSVGIVNGLAWTSVGGEMLQIEVAVLDGTGKVELTGSLGDVMKESAMTAISLIRSRSEMYGIDGEFYKNKDIHIHVPEGAVPKDGPSAGVTMTTAVLSALADIPVRGDVAMTGEITLRGRVLPIGGLREKSMAAYRHGIKTVIIPNGNASDTADIDDAVKAKVRFITAKSIEDVLAAALKEIPEKRETIKRIIPEQEQTKRPNAYN